MAHDVFISYASNDKPTADAVCATLEATGVRCWIAPRDILPGTDWGEAIIDAIEGARVMVLVFSAQTNLSRQVIREVERAVNKGLSIINFRIEDVKPARNLEYFLGTPHWLDAMSPPLEQHLAYLSETVTFLLGQGERPKGAPIPPKKADPAIIGPLTRRQLMLGAGGVLGLGVVAYAAGVFGGSGKAEASLAAAFVGDWNIDSGLTNSNDGSQTEWTISQSADGSYTGALITRDEGAYSYQPQREGPGVLTLTPTRLAAAMRSPWWQQQGDSARVLTAGLIPTKVLQIIAASTNTSQTFLTDLDEYTRPRGGSATSLQGHWQREADFGPMHWIFALDLLAGSQYKLETTINDSGRLTAKDGRWRQVSQVNGLQEGSYEFLDNDTVIFRTDGLGGYAGLGQITWRRAGKAG